MSTLFQTAMWPITSLWALAERHIWLSIVIMAAVAGASWPLRLPAVTVCALFVLSVLLMRADPINDAKAAAAAAKA